MKLLCPPCAEESATWLDYRLPRTGVPLVQIGTPTAARAADVRRARAQQWRDTIRTQQAAIRDHCHTHHQSAEEPTA